MHLWYLDMLPECRINFWKFQKCQNLKFLWLCDVITQNHLFYFFIFSQKCGHNLLYFHKWWFFSIDNSSKNINSVLKMHFLKQNMWKLTLKVVLRYDILIPVWFTIIIFSLDVTLGWLLLIKLNLTCYICLSVLLGAFKYPLGWHCLLLLVFGKMAIFKSAVKSEPSNIFQKKIGF